MSPKPSAFSLVCSFKMRALLVCLCVGFVLLDVGLAKKMWKAVCANAGQKTQGSGKPIAQAPLTPTQQQTGNRSFAHRVRMIQNYGKLPLRFEENRGQTDPQVEYLSPGNGYTLFLTSNEAVLALERSSAVSHQLLARRNLKLETRNSPLGLLASSLGSLLPTVAELSPAPTTPVGTLALQSVPVPGVLRMKLAGANPNANVSGLDELPGKSNYFIGNDPKKWRTNVANYAKVMYESIYPGVNLVYYGNRRQLEYDFVVAPGADPKAIALEFETGNSKLENRQSKIENPKSKIDSNGDLVISTEAGDVRLHKPVVYQTELTVDGGQLTVATEHGPQTTGVLNSPFRIHHSEFLDGRYIITADNRVRFEIPNYDKSRPLIIDPVLSYATYLGGSIADQAKAIAVDASGNAYVAGFTISKDFPTTSGALKRACGPEPNGSCFDATVTKLSADGSTLLYSTYVGGNGQDMGLGVAVDGAGNAYVTGSTTSTNFPTVNPVQAVNAGGSDAFLLKLNPDGSALIYSTYLGGSGNEDVSDSLPPDAGVAVDVSGNAYVTGSTSSKDFPVKNAYQSANAGILDAFVAKFTPSGTALIYSTYLGGSKVDASFGIAADSSGNAYVSGQTASPNFPTTPGAFDTSCGTDGQCNNGFPDGFVTKISADGQALIYSTYLGGSLHDGSNGIAVDSTGNAYVTGFTDSIDFPTLNAAQPNLGCDAGCTNAFITKLNASGSALVYSTYHGGGMHAQFFDDEGNAIAIDGSGNAYVTGFTTSPDFPVIEPLQKVGAVGMDCALHACSDGFAAKLSTTGSAFIYSTFLGGTFDDSGQGIAVDSAGNAYITGFTNSQDFPTASAFQTSLAATCAGEGCNTNAFVLKISMAEVPGLALGPGSLKFGDQLVGATSPSHQVKLYDAASQPLSITGITASGDFAETNDCGSTVPAASHCTLNVTFTPTATGTRSGTITITDNATGSPHTLSLAGTGVAPAVMLTPTSLTFATQFIGTRSVLQKVALKNIGGATLSLARIVATGDFAQTNDCGSSVAGGASCTFNVTFQPLGKWLRTGSVYLYDNAAGGPQKVSLQGQGTVVALTPASLNFGSQPAGTTSAPQAIVVTNTGSIALKIWCIDTETGNIDDFIQANTCGTGLPAGGSCTISVRFRPKATGSRTTLIGVHDDGGGNPQTVPVSGTGS